MTRIISLARLCLCLPLLCLPLLATAQPQPIIIGHSTVQTGALVSLATGPLQGVQALVDSVNAAGGVNGRPLELLVLDDGYEQERAAANVATAVSRGAVAMLMPIGTVPSIGAAGAANELRIPLVGPYTGAGPLRRPTPHVFNVRTGFQEEYDYIVRHLLTLGITDIAFAHNDNAGARGAMQGTARTLAAQGHELRATVAIQNDASDAVAQARELAKLNPQAVVLSISNNVAARFIPAFREAGGQSQFYSFSFLNGLVLQKEIGEVAAGIVITQVVPSPWAIAMPVVRDYQAAMRSLGVDSFSYDSLEGYLNARILVDALRLSGANPTRQSVRTALESMRGHNLGGFRVTYTSEERNGSGFIDLTMLSSTGRYIR